jgi:hypothetical protein
MSDEHDTNEHLSTFTVYSIEPGDVLQEQPAAPGDGQYLARLADDGVGNPSYAILPLLDGGLPADRIQVGDDGQIYERTAADGQMFMYRARNPRTSGQAWSARD